MEVKTARSARCVQPGQNHHTRKARHVIKLKGKEKTQDASEVENRQTTRKTSISNIRLQAQEEGLEAWLSS